MKARTSTPDEGEPCSMRQHRSHGVYVRRPVHDVAPCRLPGVSAQTILLNDFERRTLPFRSVDLQQRNENCAVHGRRVTGYLGGPMRGALGTNKEAHGIGARYGSQRALSRSVVG